MKGAFCGDIHGRAYHLLAVVLALQERLSVGMVVQPGDFGVKRLETMIRYPVIFLRFAGNDPAELDFLHVMKAQRELAQRLRDVKQRLSLPLIFLRGDHDEIAWLRKLSGGVQTELIPVDPFGLFHYAPGDAGMRWDQASGFWRC